uniref:Putative secreted protein n=1 Tax=Anopheles darlingi TaxID=43151 RepID=A0A2M4D5G8_ANODA
MWNDFALSVVASLLRSAPAPTATFVVVVAYRNETRGPNQDYDAYYGSNVFPYLQWSSIREQAGNVHESSKWSDISVRSVIWTFENILGLPDCAQENAGDTTVTGIHSKQSA